MDIEPQELDANAVVCPFLARNPRLKRPDFSLIAHNFVEQTDFELFVDALNEEQYEQLAEVMGIGR